MKFVSLAWYLLLIVVFIEVETLKKQMVALIFYLTLQAGTYLTCATLA